MVNPVRPDGHFEDSVPLVGGQFFKHADADLVKDLETRGALFRHVAYEHSYPHCWRCHTALLYYAQPSWYVRTTAVKDALLRENEKTNWYPDTIKWGRYGDWLNNNIDWALSRSRYWGTPLPIWRCAEGHLTCVGSLAELSELTGTDQSELDPHRPFVDEVTFACPADGCGAEARRVPEVIDAWFDSGSMPFAQWGYPHVAGSVEKFDQAYPADFICEAIDQTRGWFYTLMAIGTLVFDESSYKNVLCLGHILAEDGRKMSKHLGNILEPIPLMEQHGADAVRWFMAASGSPWAARRVGHATIQETVRKVLLTYWNTVSFHVLYARTAGWTPAAGDVPPVAERPVLDRWLHAETARLVGAVTEALEGFDTQRAGSLLADFVDDLSNWYVRRSRRRFWDGDAAALGTLHETLDVVTRLLAPLTPFITERVWQDVVRPVDPAAAESVHLASWPEYDASAVDEDLSAGVALARRLVELGRAARADAKVRTRQPLSRALVASSAHGRMTDELLAEVAEELNVGAVEPLSSAGEGLVEFSAKGNFRALGQAVRQADPAGRRGHRRRRRRRAGRGAGGRRQGGRLARRRGRGGAARRGDRLRATARGLVGRQRAGRDRRPRPRAHPGAGPGRSRPGGGPAGAGRPQEQRLRRQRPDRADLAGRRGDRGGAAGARRPGGRRGAGGRGARGRPGRCRRRDGSGRAGTGAGVVRDEDLDLSFTVTKV